MPEPFKLRTQEWIGDPARKRDFNRALFTVVSRKYAFVTRALSFDRDRYWKKRLIDSLPNRPDAACLDIACGNGDITFLLSRKYPSGRVLGLDLCDAMLELARSSAKPGNVEFSCGDMCETGYPIESMDVITGGYALRNAPSLDAALKEVFRILRTGGTAAFLEFSKPSNRALQLVHYWTLLLWGSLWGILLHGNPEIYAYIAKSLRAYPDRPTFHKMLRDQGFEIRQSTRLMLGTVEIITIRKPSSHIAMQESSR